MTGSDPTLISVARGDEDAFVFRYLSDLSTLGVFVPQDEPLPIGANVRVAVGDLELDGVVGWRNPAGSETPGVGVRLAPMEEDDVDRLVGAVQTLAYLPDDPDA